MKYSNYTRNHYGNIFTLVQEDNSCDFYHALKFIAKCIGLKDDVNLKIHKPFGGFYKDLIRNISEPELSMKSYSYDLLPSNQCLSKKFLDDGVSLLTQEKFGVRYCHDTNDILIPIYDYNGRLVGCKARNNDENCSQDNRFYAYLPYSKTRILYGWNINYKHILEEDCVVIVESEKGVMQADSFDIHNLLAIGGHNISITQSKYIKSLMTNKIIVAFDEGVCEEEVEYETKKLISDNPLIKNHVGYVYNEQLLGVGSKNSPTDLGIDVYKKMITQSVKWIT